MLGRDEHQRRCRHQLPQHGERRHAPRRGNQHQRRREQREHRLHRPTAQRMIAIPHRVHRHRNNHDTRDEHEPRTQRIQVDRDTRQRHHIGPPGDNMITRHQHTQPRHHRRGTHQQRRELRHHHTGPAPEREAGHASTQPRRGRDRERGSGEAHPPDRRRNSATITAGSGGQPRISASTGTTSRTAPASPYAPQHPAITRAITHRYHQLRRRRRLIRLAQRRRHVVRHRTRHQQRVRMPRRSDQASAVTLCVIMRPERRRDLQLTTVARTRIHRPDLQRTP